MSCLFCGTNNNLTDEHVFPAFSGARLVVPNGTCGEHNFECSKFEGVVANETLIFRNIFAIPNADNVIPAAKVTVEVDGMEIPAKRLADGEIELHNFIKETPRSDGGKIRHGFFIDETSALKFEERAKHRGDRTEGIPGAIEKTLQPVSEQLFLFAFSIDARRLAAKIAITAVALKWGITFAQAPCFKELRDFVITGHDSCPVRLFANNDFANFQIRTPQQHSVILHLSAGMKMGWAVVTLFGGLSYIVEMTRGFREEHSKSFSLFYEVAQRKEINPIVLFSEYEIIGRVLSDATTFECPDALDDQWFPIIKKECEVNSLQVSKISGVLPDGRSSKSTS